MLFVVLVKSNLSNKEFQCHKKHEVKSMESVNNVIKRYKGLTCCSSQVRHPRGGGCVCVCVWGGVLPYISHIGMCCTKG